MSDKLKLEIEVICMTHIIAIILAIVFFIIFYLKAKRNYALRAFFVMQLSMIGWMVFKIFKTVSPNELSRWWFIVGYYFCACVFEVAFVEFSYSYYYWRSLANKIRYWLYGVAFFQFMVILTNPSHHLFYATYTFWDDSFGPFFYVHTAIAYALILVGFGYGCLTFKQRFKSEKGWYKVLIAGAILFPLILNSLFISKLLHRFIHSIGIPIMFDITPIAFVISTTIFVYATFNHEFMEVSPIMRHEIVHKLDTALCVMDSGFNVIYVNQKTKRLLGERAGQQIQRAIAQCHRQSIYQEKQEVRLANRIFTSWIQRVATLKENQYLLILNDVTDYKHVEKKIRLEQQMLNQMNSELQVTIEKLKRVSKMGARNYVARELHDIIGHSLVVTIKLLEVAKMYVVKEPKLAVDAINDSALAITTGVKSMDSITTRERNYTGATLESEIKKMLNRLKNAAINTHLNFRGGHYQIEKKRYDVISRICLELLTNALKHSAAKDIFISVNVQEVKITIIIMDNGIGCQSLVLGNGLNGIKERLALIDGQVDFITAADEGFMAKITIER